MTYANFWVYAIEPIDDWSNWTRLDATTDCPIILPVAALFGRIGWQGDGRWYSCPIPFPNNEEVAVRCLFAVKQEHAGLTFVASPVPLYWLAKSAHEHTSANILIDRE